MNEHTPILGTLLAERDEATREAHRLSEEVMRLEQENCALRNLLATSDLPCLYCKLPKDRMSECRSGFPGCGRMDDLMYVP